MTTLDARVSTGLYGHNKIKKLIRRVGFEGPWRLVGLWLYARQHRPNGDLSGMTDEDIEIQVDWSGEPGAFVRAVVEAGFLDGTERAYRLHDWAEHQPWSVGQDARRQSARKAGLIRRYGETRGLELFHADQARRSPEASDPLSGALDKGSEALADRLAESPISPAPSPLRIRIQKKGAEAPPVPDWVDARAWADFWKHRKAKRAPMTDRAVELLVKKLDDYRKQGVDSATVLNFAIESGHTGLFYRPDPRRAVAATKVGELKAGEVD